MMYFYGTGYGREYFAYKISFMKGGFYKVFSIQHDYPSTLGIYTGHFMKMYLRGEITYTRSMRKLVKMMSSKYKWKVFYIFLCEKRGVPWR